MVAFRWLRWPPCQYVVKIFKNLLLQNRGCLGAESLQNSSGTGGLLKLLKWWSYIDDLFFTARSSLLPYAFVWAPYIFMKKMLRISNDFSSDVSGPMLLKFHVEPPWGNVATLGHKFDHTIPLKGQRSSKDHHFNKLNRLWILDVVYQASASELL